jgi:hypothetical protein
MKQLFLLLTLGVAAIAATAQTNFPYTITLESRQITGLPGLHSHAFAQTDHYWLFFGGRKDGIHARQPFNAFPTAQANAHLYVIDHVADTTWQVALGSLPASMQEQLSATNFNFYQEGPYLLLTGGYGFSVTANQYTTYPFLLRIHVPVLLQAVLANQPILGAFEQLQDSAFAVTGGQLGKIGEMYYLVGGHKFVGRYNPMGPSNGPGFVQQYTNQIRKFELSAPGTTLAMLNYQVQTDPIHLHRRDYNLVPQIFPDGTPGYTLSSGVFQHTIDLPYLYPVDIKATGIFPQTQFLQKLSHYHSAKTALYDSASNTMHSLFYGGLAQYYYDGELLVQDNNVPFVKTISRVTREANGQLTEFVQPEQMPVLVGASAEFIPNLSVPHYANETFKLQAFVNDTTLLGHIVGGIVSPVLNAFTNNNTGVTSASTQVYAVKLVREPQSTGVKGASKATEKTFDFALHPNPTKSAVAVNFELSELLSVHYLLSNAAGAVLEKGRFQDMEIGENEIKFDLKPHKGNPFLWLTLVFDHKHFVTHKVLLLP